MKTPVWQQLCMLTPTVNVFIYRVAILRDLLVLPTQHWTFGRRDETDSSLNLGIMSRDGPEGHVMAFASWSFDRWSSPRQCLRIAPACRVVICNDL